MPPHIYPDVSQTEASEPTTMSLVYMNNVLDIITDHRDVRQTTTGVLKQTGITAAGCAAGGLLMGPLGALIGGVAAAFVAYQQSDDYDNLLTAINRMNDADKKELGQRIQTLVGAVSIEEFVRWIQAEGNRTLLLGVLSQFTNRSVNQ